MKWIVDVKTDDEDQEFEVSVVRDDDKHGLCSWGWFTEYKIHIASSGRMGICSNNLMDAIIEAAKKEANIMADELNSKPEHLLPIPQESLFSDQWDEVRRDVVKEFNEGIEKEFAKRLLE